MRDSRYVVVMALAAIVLSVTLVALRGAPRAAAGAEVAGAQFRLDRADSDRTGAPKLPPAVRAAGFRFAPGTVPADRRAVLAAVARARPEARRLIGLVDGLTDVRVGPTGRPGVLGLTV